MYKKYNLRISIFFCFLIQKGMEIEMNVFQEVILLLAITLL
jgi:hypothetical protein